MKQVTTILEIKRRRGSFLPFILIVLVCSMLVAPPLSASSFSRSLSSIFPERGDVLPPESLEIDSSWIWFTKPVEGNIYIMDVLDVPAPSNTPLIVGPISFQVGLGRESDTVWVVYSITTEDGFPLLNPVMVDWKEDVPGCDFYYNHIHLPFSAGNCFPLKCKIEAEVYWNELYMGSTNMTFVKIF